MLSNCCLTINDIWKCLTDTSNIEDLKIYTGDAPNQFKIYLDKNQSNNQKIDVKKCCTCTHWSCKKNKQNDDFKVPKTLKKDPPRAFVLRRNIYRKFGNFFKDLFAKYTK